MVKMERTCDLVSRGSRIKTAEVTAVFTARGVVLFASKESDSNRSELTKQVTDAQLVKAFPLAEKFELTKLDKVRVLPLPPIKNLILNEEVFILIFLSNLCTARTRKYCKKKTRAKIFLN
ncbi:MAG: hypothetical protein SO141_06940 [Alphaproteobacteria bacterium]|nr:hypothetical protein [Alphaproteobacteria bacterium]